MASVDLTFALDTTKYAARNVYGVIREDTSEIEFFRLLNKGMALYALGDSACLEELTVDEQDQLGAILILKS